jgi:hypothetical protein
MIISKMSYRVELPGGSRSTTLSGAFEHAATHFRQQYVTR